MLTYRAGAWWTRVYCPEFGMGMSTAEEVIDTYGEARAELPTFIAPGNSAALEEALLGVADVVPEPVADEPPAEPQRQPGDD
jgi:hypothetical protein